MRGTVVLRVAPIFQVGGRLLDWGLVRLRPWRHLTQWSERPPSWLSLPECLQGRSGSRGVLVLPGAGGAECLGGLARCLPRQLLQHECPRCPERPPFSLFGDLEQHMRKQHELFCCKLCLRHLQVSPPGCLLEPCLPEPCPSLRGPPDGWASVGLRPPQALCAVEPGRGGRPRSPPVPSTPFPQIFTHERKWYSRKDLARHRMQGDPDDTSHRGHPLCKFCDERYLDNDELLKHLRRDHYFCHFCDADGAQDYYRWARWGPECHRWAWVHRDSWTRWAGTGPADARSPQ